MFLPIVLIRGGTLSESDTFWQIRAGALIIDQRHIPRTDPFSWTVHGMPWTLNSWGFDVLLAMSYRVAGLVGATLCSTLLATAIAGLVILIARQLGASPVVSAVVLVLAGPLLTGFITARPQLIDYLAVLASATLLRQIVLGRPSVWRLVAYAGIYAGWVNLHAGALLGVVMTGSAAVLVGLRRNTRPRIGWALAATAAAAFGSLLNPYGIQLISQTAQVQSASTGVIVEWRHLDPANPQQLAMFALGCAGLAVALKRRDPVWVALLAVAGAGSVTAVRFLPVLLLLGLPLLASSLSVPVVLRYLRSRYRLIVTAAALWLAAGGLIAAAAAVHFGKPDPKVYSTRVVNAIPPGCRLFNDYLVGGYVILQRPDVRVSLDSRNDLYGARRLERDEAAISGQGNVDAALSGAGCVLVPPASKLAGRLDEDPRWRRAAGDHALVLYVRR